MRHILLAAAVALALPVAAQAATFRSCVGTNTNYQPEIMTALPYDVSAYVTGATACTISDDFQDNVNAPLVVNDTPGFFNITTWEFLAKDETGGLSGTYNFSDEIAALGLPGLGLVIDKLMLVFKDGSDTTLTGYLVDTASGDWDTPFVFPAFDIKELQEKKGVYSLKGPDEKNVSHISAYYTTKRAPPPPPPVPLPAAGWALLAALGGLGLAARRRRAA
jgi:hypothetical protein